MALELKRRLANIVGPAQRKFYDDDFNWDTYTRDKYGPQQKQIAKEFDLRVGRDVYFDSEKQQLCEGSAKLHPNSFCIYESVGKLAAKSVIEIGCGGGDHLHNIKTIYPEVEVRGGDRSVEQLKFLRERNPEIADDTFQQDITMPLSSKWPKAELVYSQAVIMHIKTAVSHLNAMANMFHLASDYVVLMENYGCHPIVEDVTRLHEGGHIPWENVHFHVIHYHNKPYCLVVSRTPCDLPVLEDYMALPNATKIRYQ